MKNEVYNLIILDESGSMSPVKSATISGCNETLNTIRATQEKLALTQDNYVSIFLFQSDGRVPSRYITKNTPIENVKDINHQLYEPWGSTPLYDAIGSTLTDLKICIADKPTAIANVTIITDGCENSSSHYTLEKITRMIDQFKELGWSFNFIGANIDVKGTSSQLHIDNSLEFTHTEAGTREMFEKERRSRMKWAKKASEVFEDFDDDLNSDDIKAFRIKMCATNSNYFSEPETDEKDFE